MNLRQALQRYTPGAVSELISRFDGWSNPLTGFGTSRDKSTYGSVGPLERLSDVELSSLYHTDDMAARMVDVVPQEMMREGFDVDVGDPDLNTAIADKFESLHCRSKFADGIRWGRLYGGAALLIGADDGQDPRTPLKPERAKDIRYLYVIERRVLWPVTWYSDPGHPKLGEPETFMVTPTVVGGGGGGQTVIVHESRLIIFRGAKTGAFERISMAGWDISVLQRPYEILRQFHTGWKAVETLLTDGNQATFRMTGLADMIASGEQSNLMKRLNIIEMYRSVMRALVIDADSDESFERQSITFAGIPDTLDKFMLRLAAAAEVPVTILMGQSPAGMNATGDSDFRWFYDRMRAQQTTDLAPKIRQLVEIWLQTKAGQAAGKTPETCTVKFPPLWTETPLNEATRRKLIADTDAVYVTAQAITPDEVALSRFRPEGFGEDIQISDEGRKARESALKSDLKQIAAGTPPAPPPGEGTQQQPEPSRFDEFDEGNVERDDHGRFASSGGGSGGSEGSGDKSGGGTGSNWRPGDKPLGKLGQANLKKDLRNAKTASEKADEATATAEKSGAIKDQHFRDRLAAAHDRASEMYSEIATTVRNTPEAKGYQAKAQHHAKEASRLRVMQ